MPLLLMFKSWEWGIRQSARTTNTWANLTEGTTYVDIWNILNAGLQIWANSWGRGCRYRWFWYACWNIRGILGEEVVDISGLNWWYENSGAFLGEEVVDICGLKRRYENSVTSVAASRATAGLRGWIAGKGGVAKVGTDKWVEPHNQLVFQQPPLLSWETMAKVK
jgi:hypothetical protein